MRIIKPQAISLGGRPMATLAGTQLMVTSLTGFQMAGSLPLLSGDQNLWKALKGVLPPKTAPDLSLPKPRSEWLAFAKAYPSHISDTAVLATVNIERNKNLISGKSLFISGARQWKSFGGISMPGEPEALGGPLLLDWGHAFGSKDNAINPRGIGEYNEQWVGKPMQQIEYEQSPVASPKENAYPAGFAPLPIEASGRFKPHGTYDERWRKEEFPAFPSDTPPEQFMLAPIDQRLDTPFLPRDVIRCSGMHPEGKSVEWVLPAWQARSYVTFKKNNAQLIPVEMKLDTLWLIPHAGILGMMWRGYIPIQETDGYDVDLLFGALEDIDAPRTANDYQVQIDVRSGKQAQTTALMMLDDTGLIPRDQPGLVLPSIPQNAKDRMQKALNDVKKAKAQVNHAQSQSPSQS